MISLFWFTCFKKDSFEEIFNSFISLSLAVCSPLLEACDPAIDPALEPALEALLSTFTSSFSAISTWHLPILEFWFERAVKKSLFLAF